MITLIVSAQSKTHVSEHLRGVCSQIELMWARIILSILHMLDILQALILPVLQIDKVENRHLSGCLAG